MRIGNRRWRRVVSFSAVTTALLLSSVPSASAASTTVEPLLLARVANASATYVVASVSCAKGPCLELERTRDHGATFQRRHLPTIGHVRGEATGTLSSLSFSNRSDGYALVGASAAKSLFVTTDGAESWHRVIAAKGLTIMSLTPTASALYGIAATCHTTKRQHYCDDFQLARASLAATHWTFRTLPNLSLRGGFFDIAIAAFDSHVWISQQTKRSLIDSSTDAGATWATHSAASLGSISGCALTATSVTHLWAACPTGMLVSFFATSNGGSTWRAARQKSFAATGGGYFDPVSNAIAYLAYGGKRSLVRLSGQGRTSTMVGHLACWSVSASVSALDFTSERDGLAICGSGTKGAATRLDRTTDGGATWTQIHLTAQ